MKGFQKGRNLGQPVWVPGEECDGGIMVTDAKNGNELIVRSGKTREMTTVSRFGRKAKRPAVEGRQTGSDGKYILVKFANGDPIHVRREEQTEDSGDGDDRRIPPAAALASDGTAPTSIDTPKDAAA